jgi:hypothetical protein
VLHKKADNSSQRDVFNETEDLPPKLRALLEDNRVRDALLCGPILGAATPNLLPSRACTGVTGVMTVTRLKTGTRSVGAQPWRADFSAAVSVAHPEAGQQRGLILPPRCVSSVTYNVTCDVTWKAACRGVHPDAVGSIGNNWATLSSPWATLPVHACASCGVAANTGSESGSRWSHQCSGLPQVLQVTRHSAASHTPGEAGLSS